MHGVAFDANVYLGNTAKTDNVFYGLLPPNPTVEDTPDNGYIENVYRAVNAAHTADGKPIRIITSSWGSQNTTTENYNTYDGLNKAWRYLSTPDGVADDNGNTLHWLNGAIEAARTGTVIQFTAGNSGYVNPTPRGAAPYFLPDLEGHWFTTSGVNPSRRTLNADGSMAVPGQQSFNQCGVAKWSCVTAPANNINSTTVQVVDGVPQPRYQSESGTSMAGPHSAAALAIVMQRFPYMTNEQALYTLETTGRQNSTINNAAGTAVANPQAGQLVQVPDSRNGWNTVSLRDALHGPGQLLGPTDVDTQGYGDVWSNDISDVAIQARRGEDTAEAAAWAQTKLDKGWTNGLPANATDVDKSDYAIGTRREAARNARVYEGSLTKRGDGTLFLTGHDTWHGLTTVLGGKLSIDGTHSSPVSVQGGTLGGAGSIAGNLDVTAAGTLAPGLTSDEAARITDVHLAPSGTLDVGGDLHLAGQLAATATSRVRAAGDVTLSGPLDLTVAGTFPAGTALTLVSGRSVTGTFAGLPEGSSIQAGGNTFVVSYRNDAATLIIPTSVGGTVPATLALTLGAQPGFGTFTPGVDRTYAASTTADVVSTAGDATLSVSDPGHLKNGAFSLPSPLGVALSKSTWTGPASNDPVTITFSQHIGANDALRTGSYSKTLTFTLSTTKP
jgi:subtilase-type serine protease